jgi:uncharacterized protein YidB (DUF937 family)
MGLLDQVLGSVLGGQQTSGGGLNSGAGGGLGGVLGGMLGGGTPGAAGRGGIAQVLMMLLAGGGLQRLLNSLQRGGLGHVADSWVSTGQNQPVSPDQLQRALGDDEVDRLATQSGLPRQDLLSNLATLLPNVVDGLTPGGRVPTHEELSPQAERVG